MSKVRFDIDACAILCADFFFARTVGSSVVITDNGRAKVDCVMYGHAQNSHSTPNSKANINLRGTPFAVACDFKAFGGGGSGHAEHTNNGQCVNVTGGGHQGGCGANGDNATVSDGVARCQWRDNMVEHGMHRIKLQFVTQKKIKDRAYKTIYSPRG